MITIANIERRSLPATATDLAQSERPRLGVGLVTISIATILAVLLRHPAPFVAAVGAVAMLTLTVSH